MAKRWMAVATAVAGVIATALPAHAADTTTTFSLAAGALSISAPASHDLGSGSAGGNVSGQLGTITVTDNRGALGGSWTATVSSTDFTTGGGTADETIGKAQATYWSGAATASSGVAAFTPGQLLAANAQTLGTSRTAFSATGTVGNNSASWNPTVTVNIPSSAVAGDYTATITHSVA